MELSSSQPHLYFTLLLLLHSPQFLHLQKILQPAFLQLEVLYHAGVLRTERCLAALIIPVSPLRDELSARCIDPSVSNPHFCRNKMVFGVAYFMPGTNIERFRDFQNADQPVVISHSQEVLPGCEKQKMSSLIKVNQKFKPNSLISHSQIIESFQSSNASRFHPTVPRSSRYGRCSPELN